MNRRVFRRRTMKTIGTVAAGLVLATVVAFGSPPAPARGLSYQRISGEGSSWAANAIDNMRVNVQQFGITVDYAPNGSTSGRKSFLNGTVDFAASDIPFQFNPEDGSAPENPAPGSYAYMPITAGGTAFMYNLKINGKPVTNLRLSGQNVAKIFTGAITTWNDPAIAADNPGLTLPGRPIVPVVRSDGSGSTAQFTLWVIHEYPDIWNEYCNRSGRAPACGETSFYPTISGMIAQNGDLGVAGYVAQSFAEGAIGYVNYSYALNAQFPVAKVLNKAGFYTEPTPQNVAVSLLQAKINTNESNPATYLTQNLDGVYTDADPRNYPLSSYSYLILPTQVIGQFNEAKGLTLGAFAYYAMCQAQQQSASLGYSPMPANLVEASFDQIRKIPGVQVQDIDITSCDNPTFSPDGTNLLAKNAPQPQACDKQGQYQCPDGTAGLADVPTAILATAVVGAQPAAGGATGTPAAGGATGTPAAGGATGTPAAGGATGTPAAGGVTGTPAAGGATGTPTAGGATGTPTVDGSTAVVDPAVASGAVVPDAAAIDPSVCADTGTCAAVDPASAAGGVVSNNGAATAAPVAATTLGDPSGAGASLALVLLVLVLSVGVVVVPALVWRNLSGTGAK